MKLLKVKNGLIEAENFFLASNFGDFAGSANVSRDIGTGKLKLTSNDKIERQFNFNEFVIEIKKETLSFIDVDNYCMCYVGNDDFMYGIRDDAAGEHSYWKLIAADGYIQAYCGNDGVNWDNIGGSSMSSIAKQGFQKNSDGDFIFDEYKLYNNPYLTIQNFPENTLCDMYDSDNNLLKSRVFDVDMECKIFLDSNNLNGHLIFKDPQGSILFTTDNLTFSYGDVWVISPYNFEILYLGDVVTNINPALLQDLSETMIIKNVGDAVYTGITIGTETNSNDLIQLSTDGITFTSTLTLNFELNEEKQIYVQIIKNADNHNFKVRDFQIIIN